MRAGGAKVGQTLLSFRICISSYRVQRHAATRANKIFGVIPIGRVVKSMFLEYRFHRLEVLAKLLSRSGGGAVDDDCFVFAFDVHAVFVDADEFCHAAFFHNGNGGVVALNALSTE